MAIGSIGANGVQGFNRALDQADQATQRIAAATIRPSDTSNQPNTQAVQSSQQTDRVAERSDVTAPLIELKEAETNAAANARSIEAENKIIGSLLDIRA